MVLVLLLISCVGCNSLAVTVAGSVSGVTTASLSTPNKHSPVAAAMAVTSTVARESYGVPSYNDTWAVCSLSHPIVPVGLISVHPHGALVYTVAPGMPAAAVSVRCT